MYGILIVIEKLKRKKKKMRRSKNKRNVQGFASFLEALGRILV